MRPALTTGLLLLSLGAVQPALADHGAAVQTARGDGFCSTEAAEPASFYVSPEGRDTSDGRSPASAWRTLDRVNQALGEGVVAPGWAIRFARDGRYTGTLTIADLDGERARPIRVLAYCTGDDPVLSGLQSLEWTPAGLNRWSAQCADCDEGLRLLTVDGVPRHKARWPNPQEADRGYHTFDNVVGRRRIAEPELAGADWSGGELVYRSFDWVLDVVDIVAHADDAIITERLERLPARYPAGYFIQNHPDALDEDGEWVWDGDSATLTLYLASGDPTTREVAVATQPTTLSLRNSRFIVFEDITFEGGNDANLDLRACRGLRFSRVTSRHSGGTGLRAAACAGTRVADSRFTWHLDLGLEMLNCRSCGVTDSRILDTGLLPGMGGNGDGRYIAVRLGGTDNGGEPFLFADNTVSRVGYIGIDIRGPAMVERNVVTEYTSAKLDGSAIYTWERPGGVTIRNNLIRDALGERAGGFEADVVFDHGIYIDDNSRNIDLTGNTIVRGGYSGIKLHNTLSINVSDNLVVDTRRAALDFVYDEDADPVTSKGLSIEGNSFINGGSEASISVFSLDPFFDLTKLGQFAGNRYCAPYGPAVVLQDIEGFDFDLSALELEDWMAFSGLDTTSTVCDLQLPTFIETGQGAERLANGTFETGVEFWSPSPEPRAQAFWSDDNGGRLNLRWLGNSQLDFVFLLSDVGPLTSDGAFRVDWRGQSLGGVQAYAAPELWDVATAAPVTERGHRFLPLGATAQTAYLRATQTTGAAWLVFNLYSTELPVALERVSVVPVTGRFRTQQERVETLINESAETALLTVTYDSVDADGETYVAGQAVEVAPLQTLVLFPADPPPEG